jgi:4-amino-4-deoxy-L-arabinose transferase-like glycosyltransferase
MNFFKYSFNIKQELLLNDRNYYATIILILFFGCSFRLLFLDKLPLGLLQDEAYFGYEAWSLINYGTDSWGYSNPVHFISWGSGMNVLYVYFSLFAVKLFDLSIFSIRITQAFFGCISLIVFYKLCKILFDKSFALLALIFLSFNPWHIMASRFAMDFTLTVFFVLSGLLFFCKGVKNQKYFILSSICYGLSLYGYPPTWITLPFIIGLSVVYCLYEKQIKLTKYVIISIVVLFLLALPLFIFILVNYELMPEIKTKYISIPKLLEWRNSSMFSFNMFKNLGKSFVILFTQSGAPYNVLPGIGIYYFLSNLFVFYGLILISKASFTRFKNKQYWLPTIILLNLVGCLPLLLTMTSPSINRINIVIYPLIICCCFGLYKILCNTDNIFRISCAIIYATSFLWFAHSYISAEPIGPYGYEKALIMTTKQNTTVYVDDMMHPLLLFTLKYPTDSYINDTQWLNYPATFLFAKKIGKYNFGVDINTIDENAVYVFGKWHNDWITVLENASFTVEVMDNFIYAVKYKPIMLDGF